MSAIPLAHKRGVGKGSHGAKPMTLEHAALRAYNRAAKAKQRERNRAAGLCACGRAIDRAAEGLKTCDACIAAALESGARLKKTRPPRVKIPYVKKPVRCIVKGCGIMTLQQRRGMCPTCYAAAKRRAFAAAGVCTSGCGRVPERIALGIRTCDSCIAKANTPKGASASA